MAARWTSTAWACAVGKSGGWIFSLIPSDGFCDFVGDFLGVFFVVVSLICFFFGGKLTVAGGRFCRESRNIHEYSDLGS